MLYISLSINSINESLQVGDLVFYTPLGSSSGGFDFSNNPPLLFGEVTEILNNEIIVLYDDQNNPNAIPQNPSGAYAGDYIMFSKNKVVNTSKLKGYYLEAEFINNSKAKAELFAVGSQIYESSK